MKVQDTICACARTHSLTHTHTHTHTHTLQGEAMVGGVHKLLNYLIFSGPNPTLRAGTLKLQ